MELKSRLYKVEILCERWGYIFWEKSKKTLTILKRIC